MPQPTVTNNGGNRVTCVFSGTIGDVVITSGAGRVVAIIPHTTALSGQSVILYDGHGAPASGGPFATSGHKILGGIPASPPTGASGTFNAAVPIPLNVPFNSGLICTGRSGQVGFSVLWQREDLR